MNSMIKSKACAVFWGGLCMVGIFVAAFALAACASIDSSNSAALTPETKQLGIGTVNVYSFGSYKLHAYNSKDPLGNNCYLIETEKELVGIELLAFKDTVKEYADYVKSLQKPLNALLVSAHPNGGDYFPGIKVYGTAGVLEAEQSGSIYYLTNNPDSGFVKIFGNAFDPNFAMVTDVITPGAITIAGIQFVVSENGDGMNVEIPAINCVYTHMFGSDVHNILPGVGAIDGIIGMAKDFQAKNYNLILSGHYPEEKIEAAAAKIAYLEKTKILVSSSKTKTSFIDAMKAAFPNYRGENYLEMSAGMLFPQ
jgi:hypothetical protein